MFFDRLSQARHLYARNPHTPIHTNKVTNQLPKKQKQSFITFQISKLLDFVCFVRFVALYLWYEFTWSFVTFHVAHTIECDDEPLVCMNYPTQIVRNSPDNKGRCIIALAPIAVIVFCLFVFILRFFRIGESKNEDEWWAHQLTNKNGVAFAFGIHFGLSACSRCGYVSCVARAQTHALNMMDVRHSKCAFEL